MQPVPRPRSVQKSMKSFCSLASILMLGISLSNLHANADQTIMLSPPSVGIVKKLGVLFEGAPKISLRAKSREDSIDVRFELLFAQPKKIVFKTDNPTLPIQIVKIANEAVQAAYEQAISKRVDGLMGQDVSLIQHTVDLIIREKLWSARSWYALYGIVHGFYIYSTDSSADIQRESPHFKSLSNAQTSTENPIRVEGLSYFMFEWLMSGDAVGVMGARVLTQMFLDPSPIVRFGAAKALYYFQPYNMDEQFNEAILESLQRYQRSILDSYLIQVLLQRRKWLTKSQFKRIFKMRSAIATEPLLLEEYRLRFPADETQSGVISVCVEVLNS